MYTVTNFNHHVVISYNGVADGMFPNANVQLLVSLGIIPCGYVHAVRKLCFLIFAVVFMDEL